MNPNVKHFDSVQAAFDYMVGEVIKQGKPSMKVNFTSSGHTELVCAYRGDNGTKCAIGHILSDEFAEKYNTGFSVYDLPMYPWDIAHDMTYDLLSSIQRAHDRAVTEDGQATEDGFADAFKARAKCVASIHGLKWNHGE